VSWRHVSAAGAPVAADRDQQDCRSPPERLMRQPARDRVPRCALGAAAPTPALQLLGHDDPACEHRLRGLEPLADHLQTQFIDSGERSQIRARIGSVKHVEVFLMAGVGTSTIGRPRPSHSDRRAGCYTLNCEEPVNAGSRPGWSCAACVTPTPTTSWQTAADQRPRPTGALSPSYPPATTNERALRHRLARPHKAALARPTATI
jgi:hypothetical protein